MVLLETALAIPALVAVAVALIWGLTVASTSLQLGDAARTAARALARGESMPDVLDRARSAVPGADVSVGTGGDLIEVIVSEEVSAPVPILRGLGVTITQRVAVPREWT